MKKLKKRVNFSLEAYDVKIECLCSCYIDDAKRNDYYPLYKALH